MLRAWDPPRLQLYKSQLDSCSPEEALGQSLAFVSSMCHCQDTKTEMEPAAGNGGKAPKTETSAAPTPKEGDLKDKDMKEVEKEVDNEAQAEAAKESTEEVAEGHAILAFATQIGNAGPVGKQQSTQPALLGALRLVGMDVGNYLPRGLSSYTWQGCLPPPCLLSEGRAVSKLRRSSKLAFSDRLKPDLDVPTSCDCSGHHVG